MPDMETIEKINPTRLLDKDIQKGILKKIPSGQIPVYLLFIVCIITLFYIIFVDIPILKAILILVIIIVLGIVVKSSIKYYYNNHK